MLNFSIAFEFRKMILFFFEIALILASKKRKKREKKEGIFSQKFEQKYKRLMKFCSNCPHRGPLYHLSTGRRKKKKEGRKKEQRRMLGGMLISRISGGAIWWNAIFRPAGQGFSDGCGYANVRKSYSLLVFYP